MPKLIILLAITIQSLFSYNNATAQTIFCPPNIDFEQGTLANWEFYSGTCCPISTTTPGILPNRHVLMSGTTLDPYGNFPVVAPNGGMYSLKLGNNSTGRQAENARYYVRVPNNPGKIILMFRYAVVLQNPNHSATDQPRFEVMAVDSATNHPLNCVQYSYVSSNSLPGFIKSTISADVYYKPWTIGTIDLTANKGTTVAIDFSAGDCDLGGHFGYGYVDMNCGLYAIEGVICNPSVPTVTLYGPPGYQNYEWRNATLTTVLGTGQKLVIPPPTAGTTFAVILTPYPGFGCQDTIYTTYTVPSFSTITANATGDATICPGGKTTINVSASSPQGPFTYEWSPATGLSCTLCSSPVVTGVGTTRYRAIATNAVGCADTGYVNITIDSVAKAGLTSVADSICLTEELKIYNTKPNTNVTKTWALTGLQIVSGGNGTDTIVVKATTKGAKRVIFTARKDATCAASDSAEFIMGQEVIGSITPSDTICEGGEKQITVNGTGPMTFNWQPAATLSCNGCSNPLAKPLVNTTYTVYSLDSFGCRDTASMSVAIDPATYVKIRPDEDTICLGEKTGIKNITVNPGPTGYLWSVDTGNVVSGIGTDSIRVYWGKTGLKKIIHTAVAGRCTAIDSTYVYVMGYPTAEFNISPTACINDTTELFPLAGAKVYIWDIDDHNLGTDVYKERYKLMWRTEGKKTLRLVVKTNDVCLDTVIKQVSVYTHPIADIQLENTGSMCEGEEFEMLTTAGDRYTYGWNPPQLYKNNNERKVTAVAQSGQYYLEVTNTWGCSSHDTVMINTRNCCDIFMPTGFTPNNDGKNDAVKLADMQSHDLVKFMIANRWGQVIFETTDKTKTWDGTLNGEALAQDVYYYYIEYLCNGAEKTIKKGDIILLR